MRASSRRRVRPWRTPIHTWGTSRVASSTVPNPGTSASVSSSPPLPSSPSLSSPSTPTLSYLCFSSRLLCRSSPNTPEWPTASPSSSSRLGSPTPRLNFSPASVARTSSAPSSARPGARHRQTTRLPSTSRSTVARARHRRRLPDGHLFQPNRPPHRPRAARRGVSRPVPASPWRRRRALECSPCARRSSRARGRRAREFSRMRQRVTRVGARGTSSTATRAARARGQREVRGDLDDDARAKTRARTREDAREDARYISRARLETTRPETARRRDDRARGRRAFPMRKS